ncbi:MAG TPA: guanylate kinase [Spirochaetia bacterium]|nr:guanylate kinase [Spirochaetia bacterium]
MPNNFIVITAPSGAGKSTLIEKLRKQDPALVFSVSYTTRAPRGREQHGREYFFISEQEFRKMISNNEFLEWAEVHGNLYGTSSAFINEQLSCGKTVLLDIDVQGSIILMDKGVKAVYIFISVPSIAELEKRLRRRATDAPEVIEKRLKNAEKEMAEMHRWQHVIINDNLERAFQNLKIIIYSM